MGEKYTPDKINVKNEIGVNMNDTESSILDDINVYNDDGNNNTKFTSEDYIDYISPEEETIINELTDNKDSENQTQQEDTTEQPPIVNDWLFAFKDIPNNNSLKIKDCGQTYIYQRVINPDGSPTKKFNGFFKSSNKNNPWMSLNGVLTERYVAASLEKFVKSALSTQMRLDRIPIINKEPWKTVWFGVSDLEIDYIEIPNEAMYIFQNISENDITIDNIVSKLGFSVSNAYDGSNKLKISPIVRTSGLEGVRPRASFMDLFTFCNFTHEISHTSDAASFTADLATIQENVGDHLVVLKQYTDIGSVIDDISKSLKKTGREKFEQVYKSIQLEMNLFHVLISTSIALGKHYSIAEHLSIRSKVNKLFERIF